jgi:hypothetical protein
MVENKYIIINKEWEKDFISEISEQEKIGYELLPESFNVSPWLKK